MEILLQIAGLGQIGIALVSLFIPYYLNWKEEMSRVSPITREVFWIWGAYMVTTHFCFGLLSLFGTKLLLTQLGHLVCAFISTWWGVRFILQFTVMDRSIRPDTYCGIFTEVLMVCAFFFVAVVYGLAAIS